MKNINFDSAIRSVLEAEGPKLKNILDAATAKLEALGLSPNLSLAKTRPAKHGRGPNKGLTKGSENFNGRSLLGWIESVPALGGDDDQTEVATAQGQLITLHATLAARIG